MANEIGGPVAGDSSTKRIADLFNDLPFRRMPAKQILFFQGDPITKIFYIISGYVRMYNITGRGSERTLAILGPGETLPIIQTTHARYFYDALTDIEVTQGTYEELITRFLADSDYMQVARDAGIKQMERMMSQMEVIATEAAPEKIENVLYFLAKYYGESHNDYRRIKVKLTHQELSNIVNLTRETVSQNLAKLTKKKIIKLDADGYMLVKSR